MAISLWNIATGTNISLIIERSTVDIALPVANGLAGIELELISGSIPLGTRLVGTKIVGTAYEVQTDTIYTGVIRAYYGGHFDDRTLSCTVTGPDSPIWTTPEGLLPVGRNDTLFILDAEFIDYQLEATDTDLSAGDSLEYFIADGDGNLPPGITLTADGRLVGVTEPLLALDKRFQGGAYDTMPYGDFPFDYATLPSNGFDSFFYDTLGYGFFEPTQSLKKLNRYYPFAVTVTDGESFVRREFNIYVVGDDFLRADNTIMKSSTGVFRADNTHIRTPIWITPRNLGYRRANNYFTIYLDIIDPPTLSGPVVYTLEELNDDGSVSELPPGTGLDSASGEITGRVPYQPAITQNYKFSVRATRFTGDLDSLTIFGVFYEDTLLGTNTFKIFKLDTGTIDGINDLQELRNVQILINRRLYKVLNVDGRNDDYDIITVDQTLGPNISLILSRTANQSRDYLFVNRLTDPQREKYQGSTLRIRDNGNYIIQDVIPYLEYEIIQLNPGNDPILPVNSPQLLIEDESYFTGDYIINPVDNKIYKALTPTTYDGITFDTISTWLEVAETLEELSLDDRITATKQALEKTFGGIAYVIVYEANRWRIQLRSTSQTRNITNIRNFFSLTSDSTELSVKILRDNEDRLQLNVNLNKQILGGTNIGIALFQGDSFRKSVIIAGEDEVDIPFSIKTFEINVIGEIDSNIKWITPADLGTLVANRISTLKVVAQTSVPDSNMVYTIKSGKLPFGLRLNHLGEIIGIAKQYGDANGPGLTTFDNKACSWDGTLPGDTTFDRLYKFTVEARDRFNFVAIEREFRLLIDDLDDTVYTNIYMRPFLKPEQRIYFRDFVDDANIFPPQYIYRPDDNNFGIQRQIKTLVYAGIEAKEIQNFVAAAAKNHKKKKYVIGEIKKAIAKYPGTDEVVYEVIYAQIVDTAMTSKGKTQKTFQIATTNNLTVDSIQYAAKDDITQTNLGTSQLPIYGRQIVRFVFVENNQIIIETRNDGPINLNVDNNDFDLDIRDNGDITIQLELSDSEPMRRRPYPTNVITVDSDAVRVSQSKDNLRYISSIEHMRDNIKNIGKNERNFLPLWMRTPQEGFQELDYVSAIPICYCKVGFGDDILLNIKNSSFDLRLINFEIDRYVVDRTAESTSEQFILFANYQFNV